MELLALFAIISLFLAWMFYKNKKRETQNITEVLSEEVKKELNLAEASDEFRRELDLESIKTKQTKTSKKILIEMNKK